MHDVASTSILGAWLPLGVRRTPEVVADDSLTDAERAAGAHRGECPASSLTAGDYAAMPRAAGLSDVEVRRTHEAGPKLHAAIVRARKPGGGAGA